MIKTILNFLQNKYIMKNIGLNPMNGINIPLSKIEGSKVAKKLQVKKKGICKSTVFVLSENKEM